MGRTKKENESPNKKKTTKKSKDPNAPKRARSAYLIFSQEEGKKIREQNPDMSAPNVMKECGRRWGLLSSDAKAPYEEQAAADKERYAEEMESYSPPPVTEELKGRRSKKDPNAPKRANSAYIIFSQAEGKKIRAANPGMGVTSVMKEVASRWNSLSLEDRKPYDAKAAVDRQRYEEEMAAYNSKED